jgi:transposase
MDVRKSVEGIAWRFRTGASWRDIPERLAMRENLPADVAKRCKPLRTTSVPECGRSK